MKIALKTLVLGLAIVLSLTLVACSALKGTPYDRGKRAGKVLYHIYDHPSTSTEVRVALASAWEILDGANPEAQFGAVQKTVNDAVAKLPSGVREKAQQKVNKIFGEAGQIKDKEEVEAAMSYLRGVKTGVTEAMHPITEETTKQVQGGGE
jgi:hypothetical protein